MDSDRPELVQLWNLVTEITEQLNQNKAVIAKLQAHIQQLKDQASKASESSSLRRFNTDISKEAFATEIERLSVALVMENQTLLHENKQLNTLVQDYEELLENVMSKVRNHTHAAQTHQAILVKHYETLLTQDLGNSSLDSLGVNPAQFSTLQTLARAALRCLAGKSDEMPPEDGEDTIEEEDKDEGMTNWAEEREIEIQRLDKENAQLRKVLGISAEQGKDFGLDETDTEIPRHLQRHTRSSSFLSPGKRGNRRFSSGLPRRDLGM
ncbi:hypothetical protein Clacol_008651 [Clathrus columnatus]|uniref:Uncharacterized protein n=1 Tax=Clathrus columnatus TaxID=1419009 RepID=A0AAV5AIA8_9AGAM|nr:hypothetical protein Clacol_008651 [Clathrus columnatus]